MTRVRQSTTPAAVHAFRHRCSISALWCSAFGGLMLAGVLSAAKEPLDKPATPATKADAANPPKGIADLKALESSVQKAAAKVAPAVVAVAGGSGVVVSGDGYVLTVAHVGERAGRKVAVIFPDGRQARAVTLGNDRGVDAGMVKITDNGPWPHAEMGVSADLKPGQWCLTLGYPVTFEHGKPPVVRIGRVLRSGKNEIITDCTIMGGDSGAPLVNLDGKVIGIGSRCDRSLAENLHVPIDRFRDSWEPLSKGDDFNSLAPKRASLGVVAVEGADDARIKGVAAGSAAEKAGIKADDVVLKFGGKDVHKFDDLPPMVQRRKPGETVEIEVRRGTETLKLKATLDQAETGAKP